MDDLYDNVDEDNNFLDYIVNENSFSDEGEDFLDNDRGIEGDFANLDIKNEDLELEEAIFDPPLYKQRYHAVAKEIDRVKAKRVLDMGCSEAQFLPVIKAMCPRVQEIMGVDIDHSLLERRSPYLQPLSIEYVLKRENPLKMQLLHGSITKPAYNFVGIDFVSCIEVIEHLMPNDLKQVPEAIFGVLKPRTVAITTPNCEYNVLFKDFSGMRHWDHKFEWTRKEFEDWCGAIVEKFPYKVQFSGIGEPPRDKTSLGCCSQMALFTRTVLHPWLNVLSEPDERNEYEVVHEVVYPYDSRSRREKLSDEICYFVNRFYSDEGDEETEHFTREIVISELLEYAGMKRFEPKKAELVDILRNGETGYDISEDGNKLLVNFRLSDFVKDWEVDGGDEDLVNIGDELDQQQLENNDRQIAYEDYEEEEDWDV